MNKPLNTPGSSLKDILEWARIVWVETGHPDAATLHNALRSFASSETEPFVAMIHQDGTTEIVSLARGEWISVEDSLPQFNTEVLIAFKDASLPATAQLVRKTGNPGEVEWLYPHENQGDDYDWTVTHWMPLPEHPSAAPQEKTEGGRGDKGPGLTPHPETTVDRGEAPAGAAHLDDKHGSTPRTEAMLASITCGMYRNSDDGVTMQEDFEGKAISLCRDLEHELAEMRAALATALGKHLRDTTSSATRESLPVICYAPCKAHEGMSWTQEVVGWAQTVVPICPICNPPPRYGNASG